MAQQLQTFTRKMMEGVIQAHSASTTHDGNCCELAIEYASRLSVETATVPTQPKAKTRKARKDDEDLFAPSGMTSSKPVKQGTERQYSYIMSLGRRVSINLISPAHRAQLRLVQDGEGLTFQQASELIEAMLAQTDQRPHPASNKQIQYLHSLVKTREWNGTIDFENLTSAVASGLISDLKAAPRKASAEEEDTPSQAVAMGYPDEGFYFAEDVYYKVQDPKVRGGRRYAKRWNHDSEQWVYDGQRHFRLLTAETKLSAEQASRFGKLYGRCVACSQDLTKERSIELGYGETCAGNHGWPY